MAGLGSSGSSTDNACRCFQELGDEMTNLENLDNDSFLNSLESMTDSMAGQTCWSREVRHLKL